MNNTEQPYYINVPLLIKRGVGFRITPDCNVYDLLDYKTPADHYFNLSVLVEETVNE